MVYELRCSPVAWERMYFRMNATHSWSIPGPVGGAWDSVRGVRCCGGQAGARVLADGSTNSREWCVDWLG